MAKAQLLEKKEKLKEKFDAEYDDRDGKDMTYYDEMKQEVAKQAEVIDLTFCFYFAFRHFIKIYVYNCTQKLPHTSKHLPIFPLL